MTDSQTLTRPSRTEDTLRVIASETFEVPKDRVGLYTHFILNLDAEGLDLIDFIMPLEEVFGVDLTDDQVEEIKTFGDAVRVVEKLRNAKAAAA